MNDKSSDGADALAPARTDQQIREDELSVKKEELVWKKQHESKVWRSPVVVAACVAALGLLGGAFNLGLQTYLTRTDENPIALVSVEQKSLIDLIAMPDLELRNRVLCEHQRNGIYQTKAVTDRLDNYVENNRLCDPAPTGATPPDPVPCVIESYAAQTCRAYDKSGFHSTPKGSCTFNLIPANGFVFDTRSIEFIEHVTRRIDGDDVRKAVTPTTLAEGSPYASSYNGTIRCTNDIGTGRTCEYNATVRVGQVPASCAAKT